MLNKQIIKFLIVGGANTLFGYGLFAFFLWLNFHYSVAVLLATVLGVVFNFFTIGRVVFGSQERHLFLRFIMVYGIVYLFNVLGLWIFEQNAVNLYLGGMMLIIPLAMISFLLNKYFVFNSNEGE